MAETHAEEPRLDGSGPPAVPHGHGHGAAAAAAPETHAEQQQQQQPQPDDSELTPPQSSVCEALSRPDILLEVLCRCG